VSEGITAHVMYKWRGEQLSVFVLNSPTHASVWPTDFSTLGLNALIWSKGGRTYAMVTRARPSEMEQVAKYMRQTAE
jgi:anti-sigma factor RsiW